LSKPLDAFLARRRKQILDLHGALDWMEALDPKTGELAEAARLTLNAGLFGYPGSKKVFVAVFEIANKVLREDEC
jgi:hypothetical protein